MENIYIYSFTLLNFVPDYGNVFSPFEANYTKEGILNLKF